MMIFKNYSKRTIESGNEVEEKFRSKEKLREIFKDFNNVLCNVEMISLFIAL